MSYNIILINVRQMNTCIDTNTCPEDKIFYNMVCNRYFGFIQYSCNSATTCMRANGNYDCCSRNDNFIDCIILTSLLVPTVEPTVLINDLSCNHMCGDTKQKIDTCYWFERLRIDTLCIEDNSQFCCYENRIECCYTNPRDAFIAVGCIFVVIIALIYYYTVREQPKKVIPLQNVVYATPKLSLCQAEYIV